MATETQSKMVGLLLGLVLAASAGVAFWLATDRPSDQPSGPDRSPENATVMITDCPADIVLGTSPLCSIITANVVDALWEIEGFGSGPVEKTDTEWQMFINPTNPDVIGMDFTLIVTATGRDGAVVRAAHSFSVIE